MSEQFDAKLNALGSVFTATELQGRLKVSVSINGAVEVLIAEDLLSDSRIRTALESGIRDAFLSLLQQMTITPSADLDSIVQTATRETEGVLRDFRTNMEEKMSSVDDRVNAMRSTLDRFRR